MLPTLFRRAGLHPMSHFGRDVDRVLGQLWNDEDGDALGAYPVDIHEDEAHVHVEAELPGFTKDDINVTLENGVLHIQGQRNVEQTSNGDKHLNERRFTRVARSFTMPKTVDENKVDAKLDHGVLHLTLYKREEVKPRHIEVK